MMKLTLPAGDFAARASPDLRFQRYRPDGNFDTTRHLTSGRHRTRPLGRIYRCRTRSNAFSSLTAQFFANLCISLGFESLGQLRQNIPGQPRQILRVKVLADSREAVVTGARFELQAKPSKR